MSTFIAALAGGAIGVILTWFARLVFIGREIKANDRALRVLDKHLETWVADDTVRLRRELSTISARMNKRNLLWSGEHGLRITYAKEKALQAYRDQERTAQTEATNIRASEGLLHRLVRSTFFGDLDSELRAPQRVLPILEKWAAPVTRHLSKGDSPRALDSDPRRRTVETTLDDLEGDPSALT